MEIKNELVDAILKNKERADHWFREACHSNRPFYCSVDLRDSGYKIAPVDCNLFPAGFNNICEVDRRAASPIVKDEILNHVDGISEPKILLIPETHTQNKFYIENTYYLKDIIEKSGLQVKIGWLDTQIAEPVQLESVSGKHLTAYPIGLEGNRLKIENFDPDLIVMNNDLSGGYPEILDKVEQPIVPHYLAGWHKREKSKHFEFYNRLTSEFCKIIGVDPWHLNVNTTRVDQVDFGTGKGIDQVEAVIRDTLDACQKKFDEYKIKREPYVVVKNNAGTYGMGIMMIRDAKEIRELNRRAKNKMSVGKNRTKVESVIVQEGIPTSSIVNHLPAEPVIYSIGRELIGGFLRTNTEKSDEENLNSAGMVFKKLCMSDLKKIDSRVDVPSLELVYGSIAKISSLSAGLELLELQSNK